MPIHNNGMFLLARRMIRILKANEKWMIISDFFRPMRSEKAIKMRLPATLVAAIILMKVEAL